MFFAVVLVLRLTGKRGVQQLSIFKVIMTITMGSAAGDAMFYKEAAVVLAGLPILPQDFYKRSTRIIELGLYACSRCGNTQNLFPQHEKEIPCKDCQNTEWVKAIDSTRIV